MMLDMTKLPAYTLVKKEEIKELNSIGYLLSHNKTKARIALMLNEDNNKVFSVGFRTPVLDDTGVAHIVEHTVLCGSDKYPLKDPFVELLKGSLNTFMNAMTFPDKTIYPIASCNDKDFANLMDVYLDAVFNPMIYKREEIFRQEGWNYSFNEQGELTVNGVVYNEMKGVFSKPEDLLMSKAMAHLFPDNNYKYESGGDPLHIPELSYEDYLDFHRKNYHPSNSFIFLYGDMDAVERLNYLDVEYLSKFDYLDIDSHIEAQKPFSETKHVVEYYSIGEEESAEDKTYLAYLNTAGAGVDKHLYYAMKVLDYTLVSMPGSPIKKALIDAGIGKDVFGGEQNLKERFFMFVAKGASEEDTEKFKEIIEKTLADIVKNGIEKDSLRAALNVIEFNYREADFGSYPKGVFYLLDCFESWLYDDDEPFAHLAAADTFEYLKSQVETDYFEQIIQKYFIDNTHKVVLTLKPQKGLINQQEQELKEKLQQILSGLSDEEVEEIKIKEAKLKEFHELEDSEEDISKLPTLEISDIEKEAEKTVIEEKEFSGEKLLCSEIGTNGIAYLKVSFNLKGVDEELLPYVGLFRYMLGNVDTSKHTYTELANIANMNSGGISNDLSSYTRVDCDKEYSIYFDTSIKILYNKMANAFDIISELLLDTKYDDVKRLKEVIAEAKGSKEASILGRGHTTGMIRAMSHFSEASYYAEKISGIDFYIFIKELYKNFDDRKDEIVSDIKKVVSQMFTKDNMMIHLTAEKEGIDAFDKEIQYFMDKFEQGDGVVKTRNFEPKFTSEGIKTSSAVQFVARAGEYTSEGYKYNGSFKVLSNILDYGYLWENIRAKGGAYGCMYRATRTGKISLASYRDPKLKETNEVYDGLPEYLREFEANEREMTNYIIGAISGMDTPKTPRAKGSASLTAYMTGISDSDIQKERDEVLAVSVDDIRALAKSFEAALTSDCICVIGNSDKIEANKDMFNTVINLFD